MVQYHWSNDAMVSMDRCGLVLVQRHRYLHQNVKTDVEVSTVNKLVGEKSPNLFFLSRIEDQGALGNKIMCLMPYSENRHNFRKFTKERDRMLENRFDHAKIKLSTFIYAGPLGPTLFPSLVSINTW